jgi:protein TonB
MVLTQRHSRFAGVKPDPLRILGLTGAFAVNATALLLLLMPVSSPPQAEPEPITTLVDNFLEKKPPPPPPPPQPIEMKVQRPQPTPQPIRQQVTPQPPVDVPIEVPDGSLPPVVETRIDVPPQPPIPPSGPGETSRLEYASAPPPAYPREAMRRSLEGTVVLRVLVDVDGTPLSVEIKRSSGHSSLDEAAKRQVLKRWKFRPAIVDGRAVQVYGIVPLSFELDRG